MSLGSPVGSLAMKEMIDYAVSKGCVVVVASGNEYENEVSYPAAYANVIAVGASDRNDARVSFSNYGSQLDVVAPGGGATETDEIYSTYSIFYATAPGDVDLNYYIGPSYTYMQGTSMAAPFVAGLAALIISQNPAFTPKEVEERLEATCDDILTPGRDFYSGWGRVNVYRALTNNKNVYYVTGFQNVKSYPNPFYPNVHGRVTIRLPQAYQSVENFKITIYNVAGMPVRVFNSVSLETSMGEEGLAYWDGRNDNGDMVASGLYFYVIDTGGKKFRGKITVIK
jgi:subtilisin family serine protease